MTAQPLLSIPQFFFTCQSHDTLPRYPDVNYVELVGSVVYCCSRISVRKKCRLRTRSPPCAQILFYIYRHTCNSHMLDRWVHCRASSWQIASAFALDLCSFLLPPGSFFMGLQDGVKRRTWGTRMDSGSATAFISFVHRFWDERATSTNRIHNK